MLNSSGGTDGIGVARVQSRLWRTVKRNRSINMENFGLVDLAQKCLGNPSDAAVKGRD